MLSNADTKDLIRRFETAMTERRLDDLLSPDVVRHCEAAPGFVITWANMAILGRLGHPPGWRRRPFRFCTPVGHAASFPIRATGLVVAARRCAPPPPLTFMFRAARRA
jgi:hypothetical protein